MTIATFDIETIPTTDEKVIASIAETIKPPATIKKPDSIAQWYAEKGQAALDEAVKKTALNGLHGHIACIGWAIDDDKPNCSTAEMTETDALEYFYDYIDSLAAPIFCGHNIAGFDLPFLKHRSIILGIKPPKTLLKAMNSKPWDGCLADTMLMWSSDKSKMTSMAKLCAAFGIEDDDEIDGSMVAETWAVNPQKVINHCIWDVEKTRKVYKRLTFA